MELSEKHSAVIENFRYLVAGITALAVLLLVFQVVFNTPSSTVILEDTVKLDTVQDNSIGRLAIQHNSLLPALYSPPEFQTCIYTRQNSSPIILETDSGETRLIGREAVFQNITVSIPEKHLDKDGIDREMNISLSERCPLRSGPQIVLRHYN